MAETRRARRPLSRARGVLALAGVCLTATACVSMPSGGPVLPFEGSSQGSAGQNLAGLQIVAQPPGQGWSPAQIVLGFLAASSSAAGQKGAAREYLTPQASRAWHPDWSATVFSDGPRVLAASPATAVPRPATAAPARTARAAAKPSAAAPQEATVTVGGKVQATVMETGTYAVAGATPASHPYTYKLVKYHGQWRISDVGHNPLLLTTSEFAAAYQLRNLYFFDPSGEHLVPDPVYVPVQATQGDLVNGLVRDLITQPSDWLSDGATRTAFPRGTRLLGNVTVDGGTATVNLGGAIASASLQTKEQVSAQLLLTLSAAKGQQQVKSVALSVNGKPFYPQGAQGNPVQSTTKFGTVAGPAGGFYFLGAGGKLMQWSASGKPATVATIGTGFSALAVSPDGKYVAVVRGGDVYTAPTMAPARSAAPATSPTTSPAPTTPSASTTSPSPATSPARSSASPARSAATATSPARSSASPDLALAPRGLSDVTSISWDASDNLWATSASQVWLVAAVPRPGNSAVPVSFSSAGGCSSNGRMVTALRVAPDGVRVAVAFGGPEPTLAFGAIAAQDSSLASNPRPSVTVKLSPFCVSGQQAGAKISALSWYGPDNVITLSEPDDGLTEYPVNGGTQVPIDSRPGINSVTASGSKGGGLVVGTADGSMYLSTTSSGNWNSIGSGQFPAYAG